MKNIQLWKFPINFAFYFYFILLPYKRYYNNTMQHFIQFQLPKKKKCCLLMLMKTGFRKYGNWLRVWLKIWLFLFFMELLLSLLQTLFEQNHPWWKKSSLNHRQLQTWWLTDVSLNIWSLVTWITLDEKCYTWITMFCFKRRPFFTALSVSFLGFCNLSDSNSKT